MTDSEMRDMLVLAASAGRMRVVGYEPGYDSRRPAVLIERGEGEVVRWNGWVNDGDAFRLMVLCGMQGVSAPRSLSEGATAESVTVFSDGANSMQRTRMAIVRAAQKKALADGWTGSSPLSAPTPARKRGAA